MLRLALAVVASLFAFVARAATADTPLPTPAGLADDVRFWERIFTKYKPDQCVFHDKDDLRIIYVAKKLPGSTTALQMKNGRRYLNAIRASLAYLGSGGMPRNLLEKRVMDVTPADRRGRDDFLAAADNVRCQRGVDLSGSIARSRHHIGMVKKVLKQNNLPTDLAYLPHLESGYNTKALSRAGARGIWQLMPATARGIGMRVSRRVDFRTDAAKSTAAAAKLLTGLYAQTDSWPLAITAYNYGSNGMARAIKIHGNDYMTVRTRHRTSVFGFAVKNYYPSFLAVRNVASRLDGNVQATR